LSPDGAFSKEGEGKRPPADGLGVINNRREGARIMPSYDYECTRCGHSFETFQMMSEEPLKVCPSCEEAALRRLIGGGTGIIFRGSGFYVTDNRKPEGSKAGGNGSSRNGSGERETAGASQGTEKGSGSSADSQSSSSGSNGGSSSGGDA